MSEYSELADLVPTLIEANDRIAALTADLARLRESRVQMSAALLEARQAIQDAIVLEDGLDGAEGERVIALIGQAFAALDTERA